MKAFGRSWKVSEGFRRVQEDSGSVCSGLGGFREALLRFGRGLGEYREGLLRFWEGCHCFKSLIIVHIVHTIERASPHSQARQHLSLMQGKHKVSHKKHTNVSLSKLGPGRDWFWQGLVLSGCLCGARPGNENPEMIYVVSCSLFSASFVS